MEQEEKKLPEGLEEAAINCTYSEHAYARESFIEGAEWQKEKDVAKFSASLDKNMEYVVSSNYERGRNDMKKQMLQDAVECDVIVPIYEGNDVWSAEIKIPGRYESSDKVRVIVIKED